jgi:aspartokinase-like uncharacterized kinase
VTHFPLSVVKVGGSLLDWPELPERLADFLKTHRAAEPCARFAFIAGGGKAVALVRELDRIHRLGDQAAHLLALRAMDMTAALLSKLIPRSMLVDRMADLGAAWNADLVPILVARPILGEIDRSEIGPLPESWDATSDSIAARIAACLGAERLILLKSAALPRGATRRDASRLGLVDPLLPELSHALARVEYLNIRERSNVPVQLPP